MALVQKYRPFVLFDVEDAPKKKASITLLNALMVIGIGALCVGGVYSFAQSKDEQLVPSEPEPEPEPNTEPPCPSDYFYLKSTSSCYKVVPTLMTFKKAEKNCQEEGGHLASIHSKEESLVISGLYHSEMSNDGEMKPTAMIGLSIENGGPKWTDGSPVEYVDLAAGIVIDENDQFGALRVYLSSWDLWWDKNSVMKSICKKSAKVTKSATEESSTDVDESEQCWEDYTYFSETGKCYKSFHKDTFKNAKAKCASLYRTTLASVTSEAETLFLIGLSNKYKDRSRDNEDGHFHDDIWLGLSYKNETFKWDDGSPVEYTNWGNDDDVNEDDTFYITARAAKWWDTPRSDDVESAYICKTF